MESASRFSGGERIMQKARIINSWRSGWTGIVKDVRPSETKLVTSEGDHASLLDYLIEFEDGERQWYFSHNVELLYQET